VTNDLNIIDFQNQHIPARFGEAVVQAAPANQRARWKTLARKLCDEDVLLKDIREGDITARVVNMSPALIADPDGRVPHDTILAINDDLAELAPSR
jgi:hypothetical protein